MLQTKNSNEKHVTLVFDTSALSALFSGNDRVARAMSNQAYSRLIIPLATDAEMRYGFAFGSKKADNTALYERFIHEFSVEVVSPNQDTAIIYSELAAWARVRGVAVSHNDVWIAASCVQAGGELLTLDKDFKHLPQVRLITC